jgi:hypothetical protein
MSGKGIAMHLGWWFDSNDGATFIVSDSQKSTFQLFSFNCAFVDRFSRIRTPPNASS